MISNCIDSFINVSNFLSYFFMYYFFQSNIFTVRDWKLVQFVWHDDYGIKLFPIIFYICFLFTSSDSFFISITVLHISYPVNPRTYTRTYIYIIYWTMSRSRLFHVSLHRVFFIFCLWHYVHNYLCRETICTVAYNKKVKVICTKIFQVLLMLQTKTNKMMCCILCK